MRFWTHKGIFRRGIHTSVAFWPAQALKCHFSPP
jgi:hypothetical protein